MPDRQQHGFLAGYALGYEESTKHADYSPSGAYENWKEVKQASFVELRPEVDSFAERMELELQKHDEAKGKRGWKRDDVWALLQRAREELEEVSGALAMGKSPTVVLSECADVANFMLMVADVYADHPELWRI